MPMRKLQTNFTGGEITRLASSRSDLAMVANGADLVRNCKVMSQGGVRRRGGLQFCAELDDLLYQHVDYIFNSEQTYQFLFYHNGLRIHDGVTGAHIQSFGLMPWHNAHIGQLSTHALGDHFIVAHPDIRPVQISRTSATTFTWAYFEFAHQTTDPFGIFQPHHRFVRGDVPIHVSSISGYTDGKGFTPGDIANIYMPFNYFIPEHVGTRFRVGDGEFEITSYVGPAQVTGTVRSDHVRLRLIENALTINASTTLVRVYDPFHNFVVGNIVVIANAVAFGLANYDQLNGAKTVNGVDSSGWTYSYAPTGAVLTAPVVGGGPDIKIWSASLRTTDWTEQMYSAARGWPHCVGGFLGRLIFGGGHATPNRLSMSNVEAPWTFDTGTGADDESVQIGLSSERTPTIRQIVGSQHLQVFTSEGEFFVPRLEGNANITPTNISVVQQSSYGIKPGVYALEFDAATLFISKNAQNLRQLVFGGSEIGYSADNLAFPAPHLLVNPKSLTVQMEDAGYAEATAYIVNSDATLAVFTMVRSEKVAAWAGWNGPDFDTACAVDNRAFFVVHQNIGGDVKVSLQKLNYDRLLDGSVMGSYLGTFGQQQAWGGFSRYANTSINLIVDGISDIGPHFVNGAGEVAIMARPQLHLEGGIPFTVKLRTMNPELVLPDGPTQGEMRRVVRAGIRLSNSLGVSVEPHADVGGRRKTKMLNTKAQADLGLPAQLMTGDYDVYLLGWDQHGVIEISQTSSAPLTVLGVNLEVEF